MAETMRCLLCARRRATRDCPALKHGICAPCCGGKRRRTVNCPEDCAYLAAGRSYQARRELDCELLDETRRLSPDLLHNLEHAILEVRDVRFRDLKDREVKDALTNVKQTLAAAGRKIIYAYRSVDPRIQTVSDGLTRVIAQHQKGENGLRKVTEEEVGVVLDALLTVLRDRVKRDPESSACLELLAQYSQHRLIRQDDIHQDQDQAGEYEPGRTGLIQLP
jgi:hypothetical protein